MADNKERLINTTERLNRGIDIIDVKPRSEVTIPREVKTWMEKVEETQSVPPKVVDDQTGQTVLQPSQPSDPKIQLAVSKTTFTNGFTKSMSQAGRWLSEFVLRLIKIKKGNVKFNEE
jgi:hypothetical protein